MVHKVNVTIEGCTSQYSDEQNIIITGIEDLNDFINLYPNPVKASLRITTTQVTPGLKLNILNMQGKSMDVYSLESNKSIDHSMAGYPNGLYFIQIISANGISYKKLMKE